MPHPFDATLKHLIETFATDWLNRFDGPVTHPPERVTVDLSTVSAAADALLRVGDRIVHMELESGPDDSLPRRVLMYNALTHYHTGLPVHSIVLLLRPNAKSSRLTETIQYERLVFGFDVVPIWEIPSEDLLNGPVGLMPLAVLGKPPKGRSRSKALPEQVAMMVERASRESAGIQKRVMSASFILSGMHNDPNWVELVFQGAVHMIESSSYQVLEKWAKAAERRKMLIEMATAKFGDPTKEQLDTLNKLYDMDRIKRLSLRLLKVDSWEALLKGR